MFAILCTSLHTVQLKGNLTPTHRQRVQHPRVILVQACGCLLEFSCVKQSLPVTIVQVFKNTHTCCMLSSILRMSE